MTATAPRFEFTEETFTALKALLPELEAAGYAVSTTGPVVVASQGALTAYVLVRRSWGYRGEVEKRTVFEVVGYTSGPATALEVLTRTYAVLGEVGETKLLGLGFAAAEGLVYYETEHTVSSLEVLRAVA